MTALEKPITRRCVHPFARKRRIVITLLPGDRMALRLERDRSHNAYVADIKEIFRTMAEWTARARIIEKRKNRKGRKTK